eukprot:TRINITY_DN10190_c0_g1_i1.p1 TRINITY_DN10190_c0_g1~~TRINITY_DN10190_c0_g1_i1.p1  ORF type:complete len:270 (-),score=94.18 TRINITY_DN10190_c0_g1_i1:26-835(-)
MTIREETESGHLNTMTTDEAASLQKFNHNLAQWRTEHADLAGVENQWRETRRKLGEKDDVLSLKFLRARHFDVDVSLKLFVDAVDWRKNFQGIGAADIDKNSITKEINSGKAFLFGKDNESRPVLWVRTYLHKKRESDPQEMQRMSVWIIEQMAQKLAPPIESAAIVVDMHGLKMENVDLSFLKFLSDVVTCKYPESLGLCLLVDAPWLFNASWKVISPWLDAKTKEKIHFIKKEEVEKWIPSEYLLTEFGGGVTPNLSNGQFSSDEKL